MIDLETIGYFLFMEQLEEQQKQSKDDGDQEQEETAVTLSQRPY